MIQGNLETLVSACADGSHDSKIVCETLATGESDTTGNGNVHRETSRRRNPGGIVLAFQRCRVRLVDRNAFYDRNESHKGKSVPNSTNLNPNPNSNSDSQRFSLRNSKTSIVGLPKPQKTCFVETKYTKNTRLFPKRSGSVKSNRPVVEPSSSKVSCMGRVQTQSENERSTCSCSGEEEIGSRLPPKIMESEVVAEPVSLGGMKRFASRRRSEPLI
ncbi:uncharacterized protein LOC120200322 [Hibiscus syriacus]|uniref:uncharacterized protein LOC120200322 n=1 Tax=Hibiscus syriacus TaxID=106335 RepID=UPI0019224C99|nr:uncharacterized protein LOC120200322 [Hibiscus syriacus]